MKNSAWYHKLWNKKLNELPINVDLDTEWAGMQSILDKSMPLASPAPGGKLIKTIGSKVVSILGYILPAAAMITASIYFVTKEPEPKPSLTKQHKNLSLKRDPSDLKSDSTISIESKGNILVNLKNISGTSLTGNKIAYSKIVVSEISPSDTIAHNGRFDTTFQLSASTSSHSLSLLNQYRDTILSGKTSLIQNSKFTDNYQNKILRGNNNSRTNNKRENTKEVKLRARNNKVTKSKKIRKQSKIYTPLYNYGLEAGININSDKTLYFGISGDYAINKRLIISTGVRLNTGKQLTGGYAHPSYNLYDPAPPLRIIDSRKFNTINIPLNIEYKISDKISIKAGPVISFQLMQRGAGSKLAQIINPYDTIYHSREINNALINTRANRINAGFSGGLSFKVQSFTIEAGYLRDLTPLKVSSKLGSYQRYYSTFLLGIGYRFK